MGGRRAGITWLVHTHLSSLLPLPPAALPPDVAPCSNSLAQANITLCNVAVKLPHMLGTDQGSSINRPPTHPPAYKPACPPT